MMRYRNKCEQLALYGIQQAVRKAADYLASNPSLSRRTGLRMNLQAFKSRFNFLKILISQSSTLVIIVSGCLKQVIFNRRVIRDCHPIRLRTFLKRCWPGRASTLPERSSSTRRSASSSHAFEISVSAFEGSPCKPASRRSIRRSRSGIGSFLAALSSWSIVKFIML